MVAEKVRMRKSFFPQIVLDPKSEALLHANSVVIRNEARIVLRYIGVLRSVPFHLRLYPGPLDHSLSLVRFS